MGNQSERHFPLIAHPEPDYKRGMKTLENTLALPLRQLSNPVQLGLGAVISCAGVALTLGHLASAL
ncbi:hypothetical protein EDF56_102553 [Novosphingobium sp. PhB165]|nr:hypothetical protein EDF56_102553 [Novosphingobium sp. PhB165]